MKWLAIVGCFLWGVALGLRALPEPATAAAPTNAREQFAVDLLARLGNEQPTQETIAFVVEWTLAEDSGDGAFARNNPLNTTQGSAAVTQTINSDGVRGYATYADGLDATAQTITNGLYDGLVAALQQNDPDAARAALWASPWASSHYSGGAGWPVYAGQPSVARACGYTDTMDVESGFLDTGSPAWSRQYGGYHLGIDVAAEAGAAVYTPWPITVDGEGTGIGYYADSGRRGFFVQAHLDDGTLIYFGHLIDVYVSPGQRVAACEQIGTLGATSFPHTHVKMTAPGAPVPCEESPPGPGGCIDPLEYWQTH